MRERARFRNPDRQQDPDRAKVAALRARIARERPTVVKAALQAAGYRIQRCKGR